MHLQHPIIRNRAYRPEYPNHGYIAEQKEYHFGRTEDISL